MPPRIPFLLLVLLAPAACAETVTRYDVRLIVDTAARTIAGRESITFGGRHDPEDRWRHKPELKVTRRQIQPGRAEFEYTAGATQGLRWLTEGPGLFTAFHCDAWMLCDTSPAERATLRLEVVVKGPREMAPILRAVGPGALRKDWRDASGDHHWVFETTAPVQTYLFSFVIAPLHVTHQGRFEVFSPLPDRQQALRHTMDAAAFFRQRTHVDVLDQGGYRQAFIPHRGRFGQEAAGLGLMTAAALDDLETKGDVVLMAHELAHQWWGVAVGIRSWSDFWLNEGVAEYVSQLYLEHVRGPEAFAAAIKRLESQMAELRKKGLDRPLHYEGWQDAAGALGELPYVKGALFLHRLRTRVGDQMFWRGLSAYTRRYRGALVDSRDFQRAFEAATQTDLADLFREEVYGPAKLP